ncbi:MAG: hypothetical protein F4X13_04140 [Gammaproteobacteria bacterium]|nr:hypothetical protein [Gammaproteobacteria bacterium]MDE0259471.1 hypothetical protein [Gammaproteobacteria bacterium]MYC98441.1 hypothetical protein [Gammaproteobacteria bacterium]
MTGAMRRLALVALACTILPSALDAQVYWLFQQAMEDEGWSDPFRSARDIPSDSAFGIDHINDLVFGDETTWRAGTLGQADCTALNTGMIKFIREAPLYYAERLATDIDGQTIKVALGDDYRFISVLRRDTMRSGKDLLKLVLHEGWHWVNEEEVETLAAEHAERCAEWNPLEEEEETCDGCGGGDPEVPETTQTCTDQQVWVTWTEWERVEEKTGVWEAVRAPPWNGEEGDPDNSEPVVYYVEKTRVYYRPVTRGEWQTVRVCT